MSNCSKKTSKSHQINVNFRSKLSLWNNKSHENYWWDRRVEKIVKFLEKNPIDEQNESLPELGIEDSLLSYKSMTKMDQAVDNTPSIRNENSKSKASNNNSISASNPSVNASRRMASLAKDPLKSKNFLTSKEMAKDILNRSGMFSKINKPRMSRIATTLGTPLQSGLMNKSHQHPTKLPLKDKQVRFFISFISLCVDV